MINSVSVNKNNVSSDIEKGKTTSKRELVGSKFLDIKNSLKYQKFTNIQKRVIPLYLQSEEGKIYI